MSYVARVLISLNFFLRIDKLTKNEVFTLFYWFYCSIRLYLQHTIIYNLHGNKLKPMNNVYCLIVDCFIVLATNLPHILLIIPSSS